MTVRIGINGFGRIGRNYLRAARSIGADVDIVAVNDLTSAETLAHLLRYASTHGRFGSDVGVEDSSIILDTGPVVVLAERDPKALPWDKLGVDVVIESTGLFTTRETASAHLEAGATRVIVSAPATNVDATFVVGVNDGEFDPAKDFVVSNASCTTNCLGPAVKVNSPLLPAGHGFGLGFAVRTQRGLATFAGTAAGAVAGAAAPAWRARHAVVRAVPAAKIRLGTADA